MTLTNAEAYVQANLFELEKGPDGEVLWHIGCVDDRDDRTPKGHPELPGVAIPGASLGLVADVFAGLYLVEREKGIMIRIDATKVSEAVEHVVGEINFHTDEFSERSHDPLSCAGCGHCAGGFKNPEKYLLNDSAVHFLKGSLLPRLEADGYRPIAYRGAHNAQAVFIIESNVGLPRQVGNSQAYVYNHSLHLKALSDITDFLCPFVREVADVSEQELKDAILRAAERRVGLTVETLAKNLPKYRVVKEQGQVLVEEYKEEVDSTNPAEVAA